ncbi:radical SAM protein [Sulfurovum sp.]|uniref:B12-binding domain-containing radical SAM protein n=1 Tax=Sulfurovum sp. TaxID=1969726 RepID=UPI0035625923
MKLLLTQPSLDLHKGLPQKVVFSSVPLGITGIASFINQNNNVEVKIVDSYLCGHSKEEILNILKIEEPDVVGISSTTDLIYDTFEYAKIVKDFNVDIKVVVGGAHACVLPHEIIVNPNIDLVCLGEGEYVLNEYLDYLSGKIDIDTIKGVAYKINENVFFTEKRKPISDIDVLPFPAYHLLNLSEYNYLHHWSGKGKTVALMTSRGCCFNCEFCHIPTVQGRIIRFRSPENIIKEIRELFNVYGIQNISFQDSTFLFDKERVLTLCEMFKEFEGNITWSCSSRVDTVPDINTLRIMYESGCKSIFLGVESGNDEIIKRVKNVSKEQVVSACERLKESGIGIHCSFILGLPGDSIDTINETISFAKTLKPDTASFNVAIPYPGTRLHTIFTKRNQVVHEKWNEYSKSVVIDLGPNLAPEQLQELRVKALRSFYLRPSFIFKKLLNIKTFNEFVIYMKVFWGLVKKKTKFF